MTTTAKPGSDRALDIRDSWNVTAPLDVTLRGPRPRRTSTPRMFVQPSDAPTEPIPVVSNRLVSTPVASTPVASESISDDADRLEPLATPLTTSKRSWSELLGDWVLNILAVFGVLCVVLTVMAFVGNYSIILFKTGSMDPTIPQGSAAIVHEIPATQVKVGDIITVDRGPGEKPITHRAISVKPTGGGRVEIEMQGDANPNPDPEPYRVSTVKKVVWHVPGIAKQIVWLSHPYVLAGITLGAALLVLWAFWPKSPAGRRERIDV
ncbi:signal peptidase I [Gordonia aurantiaca]|uniref:signal peptidase I n=1 Tax=Gordonia sp. B21 TaxID=3151852 RepID=UPI0032648F59